MNSITPRKPKSDRFNYKAAYDLCHRHGRMSVVNADSCNEPFFQQAPQRFDDDDAHRGMDYNVTAVCKVLEERLTGLPAELTALHKVIGHPDRELYLNEWTVLSLNTLCGQAELLQHPGEQRPVVHGGRRPVRYDAAGLLLVHARPVRAVRRGG